jgi:hypothetical protein
MYATLKVPSKVRSIRADAFRDCDGLEEVIF